MDSAASAATMAAHMSSASSERTTPHSAARPVVDWLTILAFLVAIAAPSMDQLVRADAARGPAPELREAAPKPDLPGDLQSLTAYPARYDEHYKDTFGLRDVLLRGHSIVKLFAYGVTPTDQVIVGREGWLYYSGDRSVEVYRGLAPFTTEELEAWRRMLEARRDSLRARGTDYLFVIAPNKETIYPEYMPSRLDVVRARTRLDQLVDHLRARSDVAFLDLRPALVDAKREDVHEDWLYLRRGTHWNGRGSYEGYRAVVERLSTRFPAMVPYEREDLELVIVDGYGDTWGTRMYVEDLLPQRVTVYAPPPDPRARAVAQNAWGPMREAIFEKDVPELPRALLFHDSFGPNVEDLLARHFSSLVCAWRNDFDTETIDRAQPDVVIELFVERILVTKAPDTAVPPARSRDREAYEASSDVRFALDGKSPTGGLELEGETRVARVTGDGAACLSVERQGTADRLYVPAFDKLGARALVMCVEADAPVSTTLTVLYLPPGEAEYKHKHQARALLRKGPNRVFARLDPSAFEGRLFLHFGSALKDLRLCGLEIRAVD